jgi:hypothetical protein
MLLDGAHGLTSSFDHVVLHLAENMTFLVTNS